MERDRLWPASGKINYPAHEDSRPATPRPEVAVQRDVGQNDLSLPARCMEEMKPPADADGDPCVAYVNSVRISRNRDEVAVFDPLFNSWQVGLR